MHEAFTQLAALSNSACYNIKAVVQQTGVNVSTLRAWEQRYGVPQPDRSAHGHRLYSPREVALVRWLKRCTDEGIAISNAVEMLRRSGTLDNAVVAAAAPDPLAATWEAHMLQLLELLDRADIRGAHRLVNHIAAQHSVDELLSLLFQPLLVELGQRWARGELCIADEHLATNFVRQRLLVLSQLYAPFADQPRLICGCATDERHEVGLLMFGTLMAARGWQVIQLGQSLTTEGLAVFLRRAAPAVVALSASLIDHLPALVEVGRLVESQESLGVQLVFGGRLFSMHPELALQMPGVYLGNDMSVAVSRTDALRTTLMAAPLRLAGIHHVGGFTAERSA